MAEDIKVLISSIRADLDKLEQLANENNVTEPFSDNFLSDEETTVEQSTDPVAKVMAEAGLEYSEATLTCPCDVQAKVWDNRPQKESGEYKSNAPDFKCSKKASECGASNKPDNPNYHKGWWENSYDLPANFIDGEQ